MDEEATAIMKEYVERARKDSNFRKRFGQYTTTAYVQAMLDQTIAAEYNIAKQIPELIADGQLSEAQELNSTVLNVLSSQSPETQRLVEKVQGINVRLLENNAAFISTLRKK